MKIPFVDLKAQYTSIKEEIDAAIADVITNTAFIGGPFTKSFEEAFAEFCGVKHCVGVGNGTDALFIALKRLNQKTSLEEIFKIGYEKNSSVIDGVNEMISYIKNEFPHATQGYNFLISKVTTKTKGAGIYLFLQDRLHQV